MESSKFVASGGKFSGSSVEESDSKKVLSEAFMSRESITTPQGPRTIPVDQRPCDISGSGSTLSIAREQRISGSGDIVWSRLSEISKPSSDEGSDQVCREEYGEDQELVEVSHNREMAALQSRLEKSVINPIVVAPSVPETNIAMPVTPKARRETPDETKERIRRISAESEAATSEEYAPSRQSAASVEMWSLESVGLPKFEPDEVMESTSVGSKRMASAIAGMPSVKRPLLVSSDEFENKRVAAIKNIEHAYEILDRFIATFFWGSSITYKGVCNHTDDGVRKALSESLLFWDSERCLHICRDRDEYKWSIFHILSYFGWDKTMRLLFERLDGLRVGVDEQAALAGDQIKYAKETALMLASERGFINVVELLLGKQVLASAVNREGKNFIFKFTQYFIFCLILVGIKPCVCCLNGLTV